MIQQQIDSSKSNIFRMKITFYILLQQGEKCLATAIDKAVATEEVMVVRIKLYRPCTIIHLQKAFEANFHWFWLDVLMKR